ncbi:TIGR03087 family PEP-CTERM/XrtA system glycosyltransferase [Thermosulfuriphilus sp.]
MKKAIYIAHRIPFPPNKGEKIRAYHFLKCIARHYSTYLFFHIDEERDLEALKAIDLPVEDVFYHYLPRSRRKSRCLKALIDGTSLSVAYFYDPPLGATFSKILGSNISLIFCSCAPTAEYVFRSGLAPKKRPRLFMDFMDVDSDKWARFSEKCSPPMSWIYSLEAKRLRAYEERIAWSFDQLFLVTEEEVALFRSYIGHGSVAVIENGVDLDRFHPSYKSPLSKDGPVVVFTGAMDYWPNAEAVIWFARQIFPKIKEAFPRASFYIVGKDPSREIKALVEIPGVVVTGWVSDSRDYIALADVCVAPLKLARGIQNKVLEAMAMAKPVVATREAYEGIRAEPGRHLLVADSSEEFARLVIRLLSEENWARGVGQAAREQVEKEYSWQRSFQILEEFLP